MIERILVVDDEELICRFLAAALQRQGYEVTTVAGGKDACRALKREGYDLLITDMKLPGCSGIEVLTKARQLHPHMPVIIMTAHGTIANAVEAMRLGAFNYLLKPFTPDAIEALIDKANEHLLLLQGNLYLRRKVGGSERLIAQSALTKKVLAEAVQVARSQASVLIHGESGTGKEVVASFIHNHSPRALCPYIRVNCAAIPDTLIESEFFGHEKGAFTGANNRRTGRFELADGGTLLLDEVTEIPLPLQPKLLRVIQEQEFERVGGSKSISVDVRLISTSNRNLAEAIRDQRFREDLYYRLNVVPLHLPPLRERTEDIVPLAIHFLEKFCAKNDIAPKQLSSSAEELLTTYRWPGNIRELANIMERMVVFDRGECVEADHLSLE